VKVELNNIKFNSVAQARFTFGSDGSGQKSTTGYRASKQLPANWIKTVSWLNKGKIHIVAHEPMFAQKDKTVLTVQVLQPPEQQWQGSTFVEDAHTVLVTLMRLAPPTHPLPAPSDDPFGGLMAPGDCGFDLLVWTR